MSLEHAILVSLAERPATGYDLARRFGKSLGHFWPATHQQIYRTLTRMAGDGLVSAQVEPGLGRPDRKVHDLTEAGRAELLAWTRRPSASHKTRMEIAVKVRGMRHGDPRAVLDDIRAQRAERLALLQHYRRSADRHYPDPARVSAEDLPAYLVLRGGIRAEQGFVDWCDEMLAALAPADEPARATGTTDPALAGWTADEENQA